MQTPGIRGVPGGRRVRSTGFSRPRGERRRRRESGGRQCPRGTAKNKFFKCYVRHQSGRSNDKVAHSRRSDPGACLFQPPHPDPLPAGERETRRSLPSPIPLVGGAGGGRTPARSRRARRFQPIQTRPRIYRPRCCSRCARPIPGRSLSRDAHSAPWSPSGCDPAACRSSEGFLPAPALGTHRSGIDNVLIAAHFEPIATCRTCGARLGHASPIEEIANIIPDITMYYRITRFVSLPQRARQRVPAGDGGGLA